MTDAPLLIQLADPADGVPHIARLTELGVQLSATKIATIDLARQAIAAGVPLVDAIDSTSWEPPTPI